MESKMTVWAYITAWFTGLFGALTLQDVALYIGIGTALVTCYVNWYYKRRQTLYMEGKK